MDDRSQRIRVAVGDFFARRASGDELSQEQFLSAHPDLLPELRDALIDQTQATLKRDPNAEANLHALSTQVDLDESRVENTQRAEYSGDASGSAALQIRCPQCRNPIRLAVDAPWDRIQCSACGSMISLVGNPGRTQHAATLRKIGHFELVERLGVGGFGAVWKARDTMLERTVAIKMPRKGALSEEEVDQFLREARAAAQLSHPHIVSVHEVGRDVETVYIVSDFIRGVPLSDWIETRKPSAVESAIICQRIAFALQHAHDNGVIHRDVKPGNVLINDDGEPHIMDFGLAKRAVADVTMTVDGQVIGTPAFMSPEQAKGETRQIDHRTDIYSLGAVLYQMLTGEMPFRGNVRMLIFQVINEEPPAPRKLNNTIPRDLETICLKCLEKDPARRYASAAELGEELGRFLKNEPIKARPIGRFAHTVRWAERNPLVASLGAAVLGTFFVGLAATSYYAVANQRTSRELAGEQARLEGLKEELRVSLQEVDALGDELQDEITKAIVDRNALAARGKYNSSLDAVSRKIRFGPEPARAELGRCDPGLRDFSWKLLNRYLCPPGFVLNDHTDKVLAMQFSATGRYLATFSRDGYVCLYDTDIYQLRGRVRLPDWQREQADLLPIDVQVSEGQSPTVCVQLGPNRIRMLCELLGNPQVSTVALNGVIRGIAFHVLDDQLLVLHDDATPVTEARITTFDSTNGKKLHEQTIDTRVVRGCWSGDRAWMALETAEGIDVWRRQVDAEFVPHGKIDGEFQLIQVVDDADGQSGALLAERTGKNPRRTSRKTYLWDLGPAAKPRKLTYEINQQKRILVPIHASSQILWDAREMQVFGATPLPHSLLPEHYGSMEHAAVSPDGNWVATSDATGLVLVRQLTPSGERVLDELPALHFVVHPQAPMLAVAGVDNVIRLVDLFSGQTIRELTGHRTRIESLAWSPDGSHLAACSRDKTMLVWTLAWDVPTSGPPRMFRCQSEVRKIVFGHHPHQLFASNQEGDVHVWDLKTGNITQSWTVDGAKITDMAVTADGSTIAISGYYGTVHIRSTERLNEEPLVISKGDAQVTDLAIDARNGLLAIATNADGQRRVWLHDYVKDLDLESLVLAAPPQQGGSDRPIVSMQFSPDGESLAVSDRGEMVQFWDFKSRERRALVASNYVWGKIADVQFSSANDAMLVQWDSGQLGVWASAYRQTVGRVVLEDILLPNVLCGVDFVDDERFVAPGPNKSHIYPWTFAQSFIAPANFSQIAGGESYPVCMDVRRPNKLLAVGHTGNLITLANLQESIPKRVSSCRFVDTQESIVSVALTHDGTHLLATNGEQIGCWKVADGGNATEPLWTIDKPEGVDAFSVLACSPSDDWFAHGDTQGNLVVRKTTEPSATKTLPTSDRRRIRAVTFSGNGSLLACSAENHQIEVWNLGSAERVNLLSGHVDTVSSLAFAPEGRVLVSGGKDRTIRFWSVETGVCVETIQAHGGAVFGVSCRPDGKGVLSISADRSVVYWERDLVGMLP